MEVHITHENGTAVCYGVEYVTDDLDNPSDKRVTFTCNGHEVFSDATITSSVRLETKNLNPLVGDIYKRKQREYHGPPCPWVKRVTRPTFNKYRTIL